jgi:flagellar biogenesis protein FliO
VSASLGVFLVLGVIFALGWLLQRLTARARIVVDKGD